MSEENLNDSQPVERGQTGAKIGGQAGKAAGQSIGAAYGGPIGSMVGGYIGEKVGSWAGDKAEDAILDQLSQTTDKKSQSSNESGGGSGGGGSGGGSGGTSGSSDDGGKQKSGGGCGGGAGGAGVGEYSCSDGQCHKTPKTPYYKLEIEENKLPENWWDKLPDFDPRVYDAIAMEQAAACVDYIFKGLPDMRELEHEMEARKNRKTCPRLKTQVPRTKVIKPKEVKCETTIDTFIKKD